MRFAYIDSQGNEVSIPSVDALALRIELGAVGPDTQLYDETADRWGPAHTHEIFLTLSRDRDMEEEGFVAPPPPAAESQGAEPSAPERGAGEEEETRYELAAHLEKEKEKREEAEQAEEAEAEEEEGGVDARPTAPPLPSTEDLDLELTLTRPGEEKTGKPTDSSAEAPAGPTREEPTAPPGDGGDADPGAFDFGALDALEVEEAPEEPSLPTGSGQEITLDEPDEGLMDFSSRESDAGGGLELERPMSEFSPESPPAWMEQEGPEQESLMDLSRPPDREDGDDVHVPPRPPRWAGSPPARGGARPEPRNRPSPPRRRRRLPIRPILYVLLVGAVGVGGWYGWSAFQARRQADRASERAAVRPPVVLPEIPPELRSRMERLGKTALDGMVEELDSERLAFHLPTEPRKDWLAGVYLANASRYPDIERYWVAIDSFVDHVRATDAQLFHREFVAQLAKAGIKGDTARIMVERADSGFLATRNARIQAYDQMEDLVNAALDLHQFLVDNEQQIAYEPAAGGMSRDPVLEAVPDNKALGDRMWGMVDRITGALDALGSLDKVSSQRLLSVLFNRIHEAGFK